MPYAIRLQAIDFLGLTPKALLRFPAAFFLTQCVYCAVLFSASFRNRITWRNVTYEIEGPWKNSVLSDRAVGSESIASSPLRSCTLDEKGQIA